jgi:hypothetical protein
VAAPNIAVGGQFGSPQRVAEFPAALRIAQKEEMTPTLVVPLLNTLTGSCYTAAVLIGAGQVPANMIVDTGSSSLVVEGKLYADTDDSDRQVTHLAQAISYGAGWWAGSVVRTTAAIRGGSAELALRNANVAVTRQESAQGFGGADGIMGLAYRPLDTAYDLGKPTWPDLDVTNIDGAGRTQIEPYFTQLEEAGLCADVFALLTRRSRMRMGPEPSKDPANQGLLIMGGGEERTDLYRGAFQNVRITHDVYFNLHVKGICVGDRPLIPISGTGPSGNSNSFLDSGLAAILMPEDLDRQLIGQFAVLNSYFSDAIATARKIGSAAVDDSVKWPDITVVVEGTTEDVALSIAPSTYWQGRAAENGESHFVIEAADNLDQIILGLPLMNNYYCVFCRSADNGQGVIRLAPPRVTAI